jgi:biopolymer transport protein ExbD
MNFRVGSRKEPQLIVVSLVDVILQLVIFLLLTTTFKAVEGKVDLSLPEAGAAVKAVAGGLVVELDEEGNLTVDGNAATRGDLEEALRREAAGDVESRVLIRADRGALHGDVVAILDSARRHELRKISVAVIPSSGEIRTGPPDGAHSPGRGTREGS